MTKRRSIEDPSSNMLLSLLPPGEFAKVSQMLEHVELKAGEAIWEVGDKNRFVYFPTSALISLDYESDRGETISVGLIGHNGMAGSDVALGNLRMPDRGVVVIAGQAWRMRRRHAQEELQECGDFQNMFTTYASAAARKIAQNAVCNRLHQIDQQISRLLLEISEEARSDRVSITHQRLSELLGIRRESVSLTLTKLKKMRAIETHRGSIIVKDKSKLISGACECFTLSKENFTTTIDSYSS